MSAGSLASVLHRPEIKGAQLDTLSPATFLSTHPSIHPLSPVHLAAFASYPTHPLTVCAFRPSRQLLSSNRWLLSAMPGASPAVDSYTRASPSIHPSHPSILTPIHPSRPPRTRRPIDASACRSA